MKCPYCAEEIQDEAKKCKHCGEWMEGVDPPARSQSTRTQTDNSDMFLFGCPLFEPNGQFAVHEVVVARDPDGARRAIEEKHGDKRRIDDKQPPRKLGRSEGKFTCPKCAFRYTVCERDIGCLVMIMIFVSLGLGLIMIPFLPHRCSCKACGHKWKS